MKMIKFAMLLIFKVVLIGKEYKSTIITDYILYIDNFKDFNKYLQGGVYFKATLKNMKNAIVIRQNKERLNLDNVPEKEAYKHV